jgi:hypothetical protein
MEFRREVGIRVAELLLLYEVVMTNLNNSVKTCSSEIRTFLINWEEDIESH